MQHSQFNHCCFLRLPAFERRGVRRRVAAITSALDGVTADGENRDINPVSYKLHNHGNIRLSNLGEPSQEFQL